MDVVIEVRDARIPLATTHPMASLILSILKLQYSERLCFLESYYLFCRTVTLYIFFNPLLMDNTNQQSYQ